MGEIEWCHMKELYEKITNVSIASNGISILPKLKQEHINLTSYSRMRVDLAAQVSLISNLIIPLMVFL